MADEDIIKNIRALRENINNQKNIIAKIAPINESLKTMETLEKSGQKINQEEKRLLSSTLSSLISQLKIINNSIPHLVGNISLFKPIAPKKHIVKKEMVSLRYQNPTANANEDNSLVTIKKSQKNKFLKELSVTDTTINKLKKKYDYFSFNKKEEEQGFKKPSNYAKLSNKLFSEVSYKFVKKGYFVDLSRELRKANMSFLSHTYISMSLLTTLISFFVAFILFIFFLFFAPIIGIDHSSILARFLKYIWIIFAIPIATFFLFIYYPSMEKQSIEKNINREIPFVAIHMSAIAGSKVEPTNIFRIVAKGKEYPYTTREIKKVINQINLYGYDLVNALRFTAGFTASAKLAELFTGFATTITSGGNLEAFLAKRADTLIFDFKTESEKSIKMAETFMDIYISVVIAAPMILTLLLVMMSVTPALSFGLTLSQANILILLAIGLINIIFLIFLHLKQPAL